jgi:hypothetical protein
MGREIVKEEDAWDSSFLCFEMMWPKDLSDPPWEDCLVKLGERNLLTQAKAHSYQEPSA